MASSQGSSNDFTQSTSIDPLDIDQFINYDSSSLISSLSPEALRKSGPTPSPSIGSSTNVLPVQQGQQTFSGPSHQYELHKQQTSLPVGALANTLAVNQQDHLVYGHAQRMFAAQSTDGYFGLNATDDIFNFNTAPTPHVGNDMELDFGSPIQDLPSLTSDFVNPNAIGGQELASEPASAPQHPPRAWPGMHQQQAALAKAQQAEQRQQAIARQQQQQQQQQRPRQPQRQFPQRPAGTSANQAKDPIVEERISRLLNQMRHSSVSSSNEGDANAHTANGGLLNSGRSKKDEEDMDEDERLLASEEGKKLSSKERRQLRNKVSARAFRSRRKEYIGQLEGELAAKTAEADDLRVKNEELMSENSRLTDLTRMLLASPAFSTFLNELSNGPAPLESAPETSQTPSLKAEEPQPTLRKDVNPNRAAHQGQNQQNDAQIGMALIPEHTVDYTAFDSGNTTWADNMDFGLYDAQVYAVTSMPENLVIDEFNPSIFSGKTSSSFIPSFIGQAKADVPVIEPMPIAFESAKTDMPVIQTSDKDQANEGDGTYDLYDEMLPTCAAPVVVQAENPIPDAVRSRKPVEQIELTVVDRSEPEFREVSVATMQRFAKLCASIEEASQRVAAVISHL